MVNAERIKGNKNYTKVALIALFVVIAVSAIFSLGLTRTEKASAYKEQSTGSTFPSPTLAFTATGNGGSSYAWKFYLYCNLTSYLDNLLSERTTSGSPTYDSNIKAISLISVSLNLLCYTFPNQSASSCYSLSVYSDRLSNYDDIKTLNFGCATCSRDYYINGNNSGVLNQNIIAFQSSFTISYQYISNSGGTYGGTHIKTVYSNVVEPNDGDFGAVLFKSNYGVFSNNKNYYWCKRSDYSSKNFPELTLRDGYYFKHWSLSSSSDGSAYENWSSLPTRELYSTVISRSHVVFFETNGGSEIEYAVRNSDGEITRPEDPVKAGYRFENWYSDAALTNVYDFAQQSDKKPPATLYAGWIDLRKTVTFNTNGGNIIDPVHVYENEKILPPTAPTQTDKVFDGWYADAELTQKFNFNSPVTEDITLYAKWLSVCTVTFNTNGGSAIEPAKVTQGDNVPIPNTPTLAGKGFGGWYTDSALTKKYLFNEPVENSFTLYAKWTTDYVIVRLVIIPAKQERDVLIERNSTLYKPTTPTLYGFKFGGWYTDGGTFENEYDFNSPVKSDLRLYIRWDIDYISVTVDKRDDSKISTVEVQRGKKLELEDPKRVGYTFQGWFTDEELTVPFDTETVVEEPFGVYAKWLKETDKPSEIDKVKDEIKDIADKAKDQANKVGDFFKKNWYWFVVGLGGAALIWLTVAIIMEIKKK